MVDLFPLYHFFDPEDGFLLFCIWGRGRHGGALLFTFFGIALRRVHHHWGQLTILYLLLLHKADHYKNYKI